MKRLFCLLLTGCADAPLDKVDSTSNTTAEPGSVKPDIPDPFTEEEYKGYVLGEKVDSISDDGYAKKGDIYVETAECSPPPSFTQKDDTKTVYRFSGLGALLCGETEPVSFTDGRAVSVVYYTVSGSFPNEVFITRPADYGYLRDKLFTLDFKPCDETITDASQKFSCSILTTLSGKDGNTDEYQYNVAADGTVLRTVTADGKSTTYSAKAADGGEVFAHIMIYAALGNTPKAFPMPSLKPDSTLSLKCGDKTVILDRAATDALLKSAGIADAAAVSCVYTINPGADAIALLESGDSVSIDFGSASGYMMAITPDGKLHALRNSISLDYQMTLRFVNIYTGFTAVSESAYSFGAFEQALNTVS